MGGGGVGLGLAQAPPRKAGRERSPIPKLSATGAELAARDAAGESAHQGAPADLLGVLGRAEAGALLWPLFFGMLWGLGRVTFGLTMRYLGLSLGMGMALGYCAAMGTLLPPVFKLFLAAVPGLDIVQIATTLPGAVTLLGCLITLAGIGVTAKARAPPAPRPPKAPGQSSPARPHIIPTSSPS